MRIARDQVANTRLNGQQAPVGATFQRAVPLPTADIPVFSGRWQQPNGGNHDNDPQNNPNNPPPNRPRWMTWVAVAAGLGIATSMLPSKQHDPEAARPSAVERTEPGRTGDQPALPGIVTTRRDVLTGVDEALDLAQKGYLMPQARLQVHQGIPVYAFQLRNGKPLYLPIPTEQAENARLREGLSQGPFPVSVVMQEAPSAVGQLIGALLPTLLFVGLIWFMMTRMRPGGGAGSILGTEKNEPAQVPPTRFDHIGGYPEVVKELKKVLHYVNYVKEPRNRRNGKFPNPPKGILFTGPPGTGKTMMARAIAGESGVPIIVKNGSDFVEIFVGNGARKVKDLFAQARKVAQQHGACIIFIDEIDAVGKARTGMGGMGGNDEREQTLNAILAEMDGFDKEGMDNIILVAATNQVDVLDPALVRSGRFEKKIEIPLPVTPEQRLDILQRHANRAKIVPLPGEKVDLMEIARLTPGMSGADLEHVVKEAKSIRWEEVVEKGEGDPAQVGMYHFREAIQNILMGPRRDYKLPDEQRRTIAIHEVLGHGLVGEAVGISPLIISMTARNKSLGHVIPDPGAMQKILPTFDDKMRELLLTMGGQAAETVMNGPEKITPGAAMDYQQARNLVKTMLTTGMFSGFRASEYKYANQEMKDDDRALINDVLENALQTAIRIIEHVPEDQRLKLLEASIQAGELQGEDAITFYRKLLGESFDWAGMEAMTKAFVQNPTGKKEPTAA